MNNRFLSGLGASIPIMLGYIPIAIAYSAIASQAGLTLWQTISMSLFVYTGAGQIAAAGMIGEGLSIAAIVTAVFILNLRHIIMSAVVMERLEPCPLPMRCLLAFGVTDEVFAASTATTKGKFAPAWFLGLAFGAWTSWVSGTLIGSLALLLLPASLLEAFGIALYAMFIALLVPALRASIRLLIPVTATALLGMLLSCWISSSWTIIIASLAGALIGLYTVKMEDLE